jgi:predicted AlkP superfamily pyrophosphatase or phosphodiesterase
MRRCQFPTRIAAVAVAALLLFSVTTPPALASAYDAHPKIIVIVVIDQFRGDYLDRYRADFKGNGFRLFQDKGAVFPDCYYDYANSMTAPGHAAIGTGAYSDGNGISDNQWWDLTRNTKRPVSAVEDERYIIIADSSACTQHDCVGASPRNLMASTLGDELRLATEGESRVYGVSLKDRAAILATGASANGAFWIDPVSGHFVTSSYYMNALPAWATDFNASGAAAQAATSAGISNLTNFYDQVGPTAAANEYELNFARTLIQGEQLGKHDTTDLLVIGLSPNDILGHQVGPDSPEEHAMVDSIDGDLDGFFTWLDQYLDDGLGNAWIALTADHGIAPTPAVASALGLPAATVDMRALVANLNDAINAKFSPGEKVAYILPHESLPYLALDSSKFDRAGINEQEAEDAVRDAIPAALAKLAGAAAPAAEANANSDKNSAAPAPTSASPNRAAAPPVLAHVYTRLQLAKGEYPISEFGELLAHSYADHGGWYVMAMLEAFQMEGNNPAHTEHYSPYSYDRHVPLAFFGAPFAHGPFRGRVAPVDMAATFASLLGINQPSSSVGKILTQALRPAVYPQPEVKPHTHPAARTGTRTSPRTSARTSRHRVVMKPMKNYSTQLPIAPGGPQR